MAKKSQYDRAKFALATRIRAEATILRTLWLDEVLEAVGEEFDRRYFELPEAERASFEFELPAVDELAQQYIDALRTGARSLGQ